MPSTLRAWLKLALSAIAILAVGIFLGTLSVDSEESTEERQTASGSTLSSAPSFMVAITVSGTPAAGGTVSEDGDESITNTAGDNWLRLALWVLLFASAAGLLWRIFDYLSNSRDKFYEVFERLIRAGKEPVPLIVSGNLTLSGDPAALSSLQADTTLNVLVKGPQEVVVGVPSPYEVIDKATMKRLENVVVQWSVAREKALQTSDLVDPETGSVTYLTAGASGKLTLTIEVTGYSVQIAPLEITAVSAKQQNATAGPQVPFIGQGWISLVLAIVLVVAIVVLALEDVLSGEAIAPILGAIAGYIFGIGKPGTPSTD